MSSASSFIRGVRSFALAAAALAVLSAGAPAFAQDEAALRQEFDELFQRSLREPTNLDVAFRYAEVAARLGDFEAAITALERMLFFNPNLPRVQLELGVLYFRLGSYEAARSYLLRARSAADAPPDVRERIDLYLAQIDKLQSPHQYSGTVFGGVQYQSNATVGPSAFRSIFGATDAPAGVFGKQSDVNFFLSASAVYSYDLQNQDRDAIEVTGNAFLSRYKEQNRFDLGFIEATVGPRFRFGSAGFEGTSIKPYGIVNFVALGDEPYFHTYGLGGELSQDITRDWTARLNIEHREKNYHNADERPTSRQLTGWDNVFALNTAYSITNTQLLSLTLSIIDEHTRAVPSILDGTDIRPLNNKEYGITVGYQIAYDAPFLTGWAPWQTAVAVGRFSTLYGEPDPLVDPSVTRHDRRWRIALTQTFPITDSLGILFQYQRDIVSSTLPNFAYTNNQFALGPQFRF